VSGAIARDAFRVLLRGRALPVALAAGLLLGAFVAAARPDHSHSHESLAPLVDAAAHSTAAASSLLSGIFLLLSGIGVVLGLRLAGEDRASGLLTQVAVRRAARLPFVLNRVAGLSVALLACGTTALVGAAMLARVAPWSLPPPSQRHLASHFGVGGDAVAEGVRTSLSEGRVATFGFEGVAIESLRVAIEPHALLLKPMGSIEGPGFDGRVALQVTVAPAGGAAGDPAAPRKFDLADLRATRVIELPLHPPLPVGDHLVSVENRTRGANLWIDAGAVEARGGRVGAWREVSIVLLLAFAAAFVAATLAFACGTWLSSGPAALAASFLVTVGIARATVIDLIEGGGDGTSPLRAVARAIASAAPDLGSFDRGASFGEGDATPLAFAATRLALAIGFASLLVAIAALGALGALGANGRDER
jgi:hypothetical protein